jgi:hypothetical protein
MFVAFQQQKLRFYQGNILIEDGLSRGLLGEEKSP